MHTQTGEASDSEVSTIKRPSHAANVLNFSAKNRFRRLSSCPSEMEFREGLRRRRNKRVRTFRTCLRGNRKKHSRARSRGILRWPGRWPTGVYRSLRFVVHRRPEPSGQCQKCFSIITLRGAAWTHRMPPAKKEKKNEHILDHSRKLTSYRRVGCYFNSIKKSAESGPFRYKLDQIWALMWADTSHVTAAGHSGAEIDPISKDRVAQVLGTAVVNTAGKEDAFARWKWENMNRGRLVRVWACVRRAQQSRAGKGNRFRKKEKSFFFHFFYLTW